MTSSLREEFWDNIQTTLQICVPAQKAADGQAEPLGHSGAPTVCSSPEISAAVKQLLWYKNKDFSSKTINPQKNQESQESAQAKFCCFKAILLYDYRFL